MFICYYSWGPKYYYYYCVGHNIRVFLLMAITLLDNEIPRMKCVHHIDTINRTNTLTLALILIFIS